MTTIHEDVQVYYGETLQGTDDLQTNACCTLAPPPPHIRRALKRVADEVKDKYYGCGLTIPEAVGGLRVLDLGSGSGRDCYIAAQLVGERGEVIGVDMTPAQLDVANRYVEHHRAAFGYARSNVSFVQGNIEQLDTLGLEAGSFDLIISNCVVNLAEDKAKVLRDVYALLKPGGELYFSDVYSDRRVPASLRADQLLWNECLSGALYWNDFLNLARQAGFTDPRAVENKPITVNNAALSERLGDIAFHSVTYRLFKLDGLESDCEDYGQAVAYRGSIDTVPHGFVLDDHHYFPTGKILPVCGNTYRMLHDTRFRDAFDFYGTWDTHHGIFEGCGGAAPFSVGPANATDAASCC